MGRTILLSVFNSLLILASYAQIDSAQIAQLATVELSKITTVVEGEVINIEMYAGDEDGNRMPESSIVWEGSGYGFYRLPNGNLTPGYTLATVAICQVYKGSTELDTIKILSKPPGLTVHKMPYLDRDTTWYYNTGGAEDQWPRGNNIGPRQEGSKQVFFCYNWEIEPVNEFYKLSIAGGVGGFNSEWDPNAVYPHEDLRLYCSPSGPLKYLINQDRFYNRQEMNDFLLDIPLLNLSVSNNNNCVPANAVNQQKKTANGGNGDVKGKQKIDYEQNLRNYKEWEKRSLEKINQQKL
jgi:hypothetical protein